MNAKQRRVRLRAWHQKLAGSPELYAKLKAIRKELRVEDFLFNINRINDPVRLSGFRVPADDYETRIGYHGGMP